MELPIQIVNINKKLAELHGKHLDGRPYFRLSWPSDQRELRYGTFRYFSPNDIFIRQETKADYRKKYPYLKDRWLLEKLMFPNTAMWDPALIGLYNGTYEPVWYFDGPDYYVPQWEAIQFLVRLAIYGPDEVQKLTPEEIEKLDRANFEKEYQQHLEFLDEQSPDLAHALKHGEAVFIDSTQKLGDNSNGKEHSNIVLSGTN